MSVDTSTVQAADITATHEPFTSLADFLDRAKPGDTFTEEGGSSRSITTYQFTVRTEAKTSAMGGMDDEGSRGGLVRTIFTTHYGKAEYSGRPNKVYRSTDSHDNPIRMTSREYLGSNYDIISRQVHLGSGGVYLVLQEDGPRYSAKTLAALHAQALKECGI